MTLGERRKKRRDRRWRAALLEVPLRDRKLIERMYREGYGVPSICAELGWGKPGTTQGWFRLRKMMDSMGLDQRTASEAAKLAWENRK